MAEEINDCEFYREDFSAQSAWEVLNAQFCEILQKWEVSNSDWGKECAPRDLYCCDWLVQKEVLNFLTEEITVTYYRAQLEDAITEGVTFTNVNTNINTNTITRSQMFNDLLSLQNPFDIPVAEYQCNGIPLLAQLYHLRRFVLIQLTNNNKRHLNDFYTYLNTISVVTSEVNSSVPLFLQLYDPQWCYFTGIGISFNMYTNFDVVTLYRCPKEYHYLSGLLKMFNDKVPKHYEGSIIVSIKNTYSMGEIKIRMPIYVPLGMTMNTFLTTETKEEESIISISQFIALPHGFIPNTRTETYAIFTWPTIAANTVIDSPLQTYFTPLNASCAFLYQVVHGASYLSLCLKDYVKLNECSNSLESYVGRDICNVNYTPQDLPKSNSVKIKHHWQCKNSMECEQLQQKKIPGPICEYELNQMLYYLFPDMHPDDPLFPYQQIKERTCRIKSTCPDSIVQRLSCLLATCYAHFGGESGMAQLWAAFVRELNILWSSYLIIPGVMPGYPDHQTCLLHQKLQVLNTCIKRRVQQQQNIFLENMLQSNYSTANDDDEFYDCLDMENDQSNGETKDVEIFKAEGRLKRLGNLKLLKGDDFIYVPITQEVPPKTEDQIQDDAAFVLQTVSDTNLDVTTQQMMCSCLFSDMESFKAANVNANMEDFIRWYSPKDWEEVIHEDGEKSYRLSARMSKPNNTWLNMWQNAKPIPARKQKCLFDASKEGLKILQYLEQRSLSDVYQLTIIPLMHSSILKLEDIFRNSNVFDILEQYLNSALNDLYYLSKDIDMHYASTYSKTEFPNLLPLVEKIAKVERIFYQYKCFRHIFNDNSEDGVKLRFKEMLKNDGIYSFKNDNKKYAEHELNDVTEDEQFLKIIRNHLSASNSHGNLISKDYIIRLHSGDASSSSSEKIGDAAISAKIPQFLRATINGENLRLCGAFTEDIVTFD